MVRMTDLIKKVMKGRKNGGEEQPSLPEEKQPAKAPEGIPAFKKETPPQAKKVEFSQLVGNRKASLSGEEDIGKKFMEVYAPNEKETKELYSEAVKFVKNMFDTYTSGGRINKDDLTNISRKIVNNIIAGSGELLRLSHGSNSLNLHRYYNAVNVSILAVEMGVRYQYNKSALLDLAIIGLLHDMDLMKNKGLINKPGKLDKKELGEIRKHPINLAAYAHNFLGFKDEIVKGILQHHERQSGEGYVSGLNNGNIHDFAVIMGLADTYEAIMHDRPYKKHISPHETVMEIIRIGKRLFSNKPVKALVACVGIYPNGSWVELNTGEMGIVSKINRDAPMRPVIGILMDKMKNKLSEARTVDLEKMPFIYIKKALSNQ